MTKTKKNKAQAQLTPKQAAIAAGNIMRGLDNSIKEAERGVLKLTAFRERIGSLTSGLSNLASAPAQKPTAAKAAPAKTPAKPAKPAKPATKAAAKAPAKPVKDKKPAAAKPVKAAAAKPVKPAKSKPAKAEPKTAESENTYKDPVPGRPSLREAVKESVRANGNGSPIEVYDRVCTKYGYWSKQSYYVLLKKDPEIKVEKKDKESIVSLVAAGSKPAAKKAEPKSDKVEALVRQVEADRATSAVV